MKMHLPTIFLAIAIVALAGSVMYATRYSTERVDRFDVITIDHWTGAATVCNGSHCRTVGQQAVTAAPAPTAAQPASRDGADIISRMKFPAATPAPAVPAVPDVPPGAGPRIVDAILDAMLKGWQPPPPTLDEELYDAMTPAMDDLGVEPGPRRMKLTPAVVVGTES